MCRSLATNAILRLVFSRVVFGFVCCCSTCVFILFREQNRKRIVMKTKSISLRKQKNTNSYFLVLCFFSRARVCVCARSVYCVRHANYVRFAWRRSLNKLTNQFCVENDMIAEVIVDTTFFSAQFVHSSRLNRLHLSSICCNELNFRNQKNAKCAY